MGTAALALLGVLLLAGCAAVPKEPVPMPYAFAMGAFTDTRTDTMRLDAEAQPYAPDVMALQQAVLSQLPATRWGPRPALLDMELQHFETSALNQDRALSIAMRLRGRDSAGYDLGSVDATCSAVGFSDASDPEEAVRLVKNEGLQALHPAARDKRQWDALTTQCAADLVRQLRNRLLQPPELIK
jgi:hypothetical protein